MQPSARGRGRPQQLFEGGREESCGFRAFLIQILGYAACRGACARLHAVCAFTGDQKGCLRLWDLNPRQCMPRCCQQTERRWRVNGGAATNRVHSLHRIHRGNFCDNFAAAVKATDSQKIDSCGCQFFLAVSKLCQSRCHPAVRMAPRQGCYLAVLGSRLAEHVARPPISPSSLLIKPS